MRYLLALASLLGAQTYDVLLLNGRVMDGTGGAGFLGDVAIRGDRIAAIKPAGLLRDAAAKRRIGGPAEAGTSKLCRQAAVRSRGGDGKALDGSGSRLTVPSVSGLPLFISC